MHKSAHLLLAVFVLFAGWLDAVGAAQDASVVALYTFDNYNGSVVADSSGSGLNGRVVGKVERVPGIRGHAVAFDGLARINVPTHYNSLELNLEEGMSLAVWARGSASRFRWVRPDTTYSSARGPDFQVCGDVIHMVFGSDHPTKDNPSRQPNSSRPWNDWHVWTGTLDVNLTDWRDQQRTTSPLSGVEPKLVVHGGRIFYEYFGQDTYGVWQIYTAQANADGSDWRVTQRTHHPAGYRVEQLFNLQVASERIHYAWEQKNVGSEQWQMWTASSSMDGSDFKAVPRTTDGGGIPQLQVVGDKIYYLYPHPPAGSEVQTHYSRRIPQAMTFAQSNLDGTDWKILRVVDGVTHWGGWGAFQVSDGRIYMTVNKISEDRHIHLFTGSMNVEGQDLRLTQRTFGPSNSGIPQGGRGMQVVGDKIHYAFQLDDGRLTIDEFYASAHKNANADRGIRVWTAVANRDGSNWHATARTDSSPSILLGYQGVQLVGGKAYYAGFESPPLEVAARERGDRYHALMATSGANLLNKGDSYGIGLSESNELQGFINAGQGYLYRGEAPADTAGAVVDATLSDQKWHHVVVTYDRSRLALYVDGRLKASRPYAASVGRNPFPLMIGDGFQGSLDELSILNRAATPEEIADWYTSGLTIKQANPPNGARRIALQRHVDRTSPPSKTSSKYGCQACRD